MKWLCGGPGAGYLYVRPDLAPTLQPAFVGWAAHAEPFAFETGADSLRRRPRAVPERHAERAGAVFGAGRLRDRREHRRRRHSRPIAPPDPAPDRRRRTAAGFRVNTPTADHERAGAVIIDVPDGYAVTAGADSPRGDRRLPPRRRHPHVAAFLQHRSGHRSRDGGAALDRERSFQRCSLTRCDRVHGASGGGRLSAGHDDTTTRRQRRCDRNQPRRRLGQIVGCCPRAEINGSPRWRRRRPRPTLAGVRADGRRQRKQIGAAKSVTHNVVVVVSSCRRILRPKAANPPKAA